MKGNEGDGIALKNKLNYIWTCYFGRFFLSGRFWVTMLLFGMGNNLLFSPMADKMKEKDFVFSVWELIPFYLTNTSSMILFYLVFVFLVSIFPEWEGVQGELVRIGKKWWVIQHLIYIVLTSILEYIVLFLSLFITFLPVHQMQDHWSDMIQGICATSKDLMGMDVNIRIFLDGGMLRLGNPLVVNCITFGLCMGCCVLLGLLSFALNTRYRRGIGSFVAAAGVMLRSVLEAVDYIGSGSLLFRHIYQVARYGAYPLYQSDLQHMVYQTVMPVHVRIEMGYIYFLVIDIFLLLFMIVQTRRWDLSGVI